MLLLLKKEPMELFNKQNNIKINIVGVRLEEGGIRKYSIKGCVNKNGKVIKFYPLLNFTNQDVTDLINHFGIELNDAYTIWGLKRTGCFGCPFSKDWKKELELLQKIEPNKYKAAINLFDKSYKLKQKGEN